MKMLEKKLSEMPIKAFLENVASSSPTPGGGSVAAAVGAMGASLASMYCRLTIGNENFNHVENLFQEILQKTEALRRDFTSLIDRDTEAFNQLMKAYRLPRKTESEKKEKSEEIQNAYIRAAETPLETAKKAKQLIKITEEIARHGNKNAFTDVLVSALCGLTSLKAAIINVKINLNSIKDNDYVRSTQQKIKTTSKNAEQIVTNLIEDMKANIDG